MMKEASEMREVSREHGTRNAARVYELGRSLACWLACLLGWLGCLVGLSADLVWTPMGAWEVASVLRTRPSPEDFGFCAFCYAPGSELGFSKFSVDMKISWFFFL